MNIERVHPELRAVIKRMPSLPFHNRLFVTCINFLMKLAPKAKSSADLKITEKKIGHAGVRIYEPVGKLSGAGLLWIHGGGLLTGSAATNDRECSILARELRLVVVSVEYRLIPNKFPGALDDCVAAWQWFQKAAHELGVDPARIAVSGQSAGGGLAAALVQRIFDEGGIQPAAQALLCPMLDDRTGARSELDIINHRTWNNRCNRIAWSSYLGVAAGADNVPPYAVPARRENLSGLPATWIGIGDIDLFYEEDCAYSTRLNEAGVNCQLHIVPMAPHGFEIFVPDAPITRAFYESYHSFLRNSLQCG